MGLFGSFHCVGMCGPLAMSLPIYSNDVWVKFYGSFLYNAGRVLTYSLFGLVFGLVGQSFRLFGFQQGLSVIIGIAVILFIFLPKKYLIFSNQIILVKYLGRLREQLARLFSQRNQSSLLLIGALNGLLPCGLVYMAASAAVTAGSIQKSILFMSFFGLGTLPMMWAVAFFGGFANLRIRQSIRNVYPYMIVIMGCLLILRGMGLGIKNVSPGFDHAKTIVISCLPDRH